MVKSALKILMWVILGVLAFLLFLLLLPLLLVIIFAPVRYSIDAKVGEENFALVRVRYLLGLFRLTYEYPAKEGKDALTVAAAWHTFTKPEEKEDKPGVLPDETPQEEIIPKDVAETAPEKPAEEPPEEPSNKGGSYQKFKNTAQSVLTYPHLKTIISLVFQCLKKTGKVFLPKHVDIYGSVGFSDPSTTGLVMGACESLTGVLGLRDKIRLYGKFEADNTDICLDIDVRGSVSIARLSWPVIWLVLKKPVRTLIIDLLRS